MSDPQAQISANQTPETVNGRRLDSWNEIAAYLERDVRTVRRWEKRESLPVHRHFHSRQGTVYAYSAEIDAWLESRRPGQMNENGSGQSQGAPRMPDSRSLAVAGVVAAAICLGLFAAARHVAPSESPQPARRFSMTLGDVRPVVSPNGRHIAFLSSGNLWVRDLGREEPRKIPGLEDVEDPGPAYPSGAYRLAWSPDSRELAIFDGLALRRVSVVEEAPVQTICLLPRIAENVPMAGLSGLVWRRDGDAVLFSLLGGGVYEVPAMGGAPELLVEHPHVEGLTLAYPEAGDPVLLYLASADGSPNHELIARSHNGDLVNRAVVNGMWGELVWSPTGHILYRRGPRDTPSIWAVPFSPDDNTVAPEGVRIARFSESPSIAADGTLVYLDRGAIREQHLVWRGRDGASLGPAGVSYPFLDNFELSPDGERIVAVARDHGPPEAWLHDMMHKTKVKISPPEQKVIYAIWGESDTEILYTASQPDKRFPTDIFAWSTASGGAPRVLFSSEELVGVTDRSRDGRFVLFTRSYYPDTAILYRRSGREPDDETIVRLSPPAMPEAVAMLSPNGRFLAYCTSNPEATQVFVRPFPDGPGRWPISGLGGEAPRWGAAGDELFFAEGGALMRVPVSLSGAFSHGAPERLFEHPNLVGTVAPYPRYDVAADGSRFLTIETERASEEPLVRVVENWFSELGERGAASAAKK